MSRTSFRTSYYFNSRAEAEHYQREKHFTESLIEEKLAIKVGDEYHLINRTKTKTVTRWKDRIRLSSDLDKMLKESRQEYIIGVKRNSASKSTLEPVDFSTDATVFIHAIPYQYRDKSISKWGEITYEGISSYNFWLVAIDKKPVTMINTHPEIVNEYVPRPG